MGERVFRVRRCAYTWLVLEAIAYALQGRSGKAEWLGWRRCFFDLNLEDTL